MCPLLAGLMRAAANEAPASVTKYLSKPSGCITIKLPQTTRVRKDAPTPTPSHSSTHGHLDQQTLTSTFECHSGFCLAEGDGCGGDGWMFLVCLCGDGGWSFGGWGWAGV